MFEHTVCHSALCVIHKSSVMCKHVKIIERVIVADE